MSPGTDENRLPQDFARKLDELLAGQPSGSGKPPDTETPAELEFAQKMLVYRAYPSSSFRGNLKQRLLAKMAEQEASLSSSEVPTLTHTHSQSFWSRLRRLFSSPPVWSMAAATAAVVIIAAVVVWRTGFFSADERPLLTAQNGSGTVSVAARVDGLQRAYAAGETVTLRFSFQNVTADTLTLTFPFDIGIENTGAETVRVFNPGQEIITLLPGEVKAWVLDWDQRDAAGQLVPAGDYNVVMYRFTATEDSSIAALEQTPVITILPAP